MSIVADKKEKRYVSDNAQLMSEWNWEKNNAFGLDPPKLTCGTSKKAWWKCSMGHEWEAKIYFRTTGHRGCPICARETQTSFPEQTLFYYLKRLYNKVLNRYIINGCEIDVYIEDINTGIEYDGYFFHSSKKALELEKHKNEQIDEICKFDTQKMRTQYPLCKLDNRCPLLP